jgi:hypothetical protein
MEFALQIDVSRFIEELNIALLLRSLGCRNKTLNREVQVVAPVVTEHMSIAVGHFKIDPYEAHVLIGQQILSHHYGELLAIRFREWVHTNYEIGSDESAYTRPVVLETGATEPLMQEAA